MEHTQLRNQGLAASANEESIVFGPQTFVQFLDSLVDFEIVLADGELYKVLYDGTIMDADALAHFPKLTDPFENFATAHSSVAGLPFELVTVWWGDFFCSTGCTTFDKADYANVRIYDALEVYRVGKKAEAVRLRRKQRKAAYRREHAVVSARVCDVQDTVFEVPYIPVPPQAVSVGTPAHRLVDPGLRVLKRYHARLRYDAHLVRSAVGKVFSRVVQSVREADKLEEQLTVVRRLHAFELSRIVNQSGVVDAKAKRAARDAIQREAAKAAKEAKRKKVPKRDREDNVRQARAARNAEKQSSGYDNMAYAAAGLAGGAGLYLLYNKLTRLVTHADQSVSSFGDFFTILLEGARSLKRTLGDMLARLPVVLIVFFVIRTVKEIPAVLFQLLLAALSSFCGKIIWDQISKFFLDRNFGSSGNGDVPVEVNLSGVVNQANAFSSVSGIFSHLPNIDTVWTTLPGLFVTTFCCYVFKDGVDSYTFDAFMRRVGGATRSADGVSSLVTWLVSALEICVNFALEQFGMEKVKLLDRDKAPLFEWFRSVDAFCAKDTVGGVVDPAILDSLDGMVKQGYHMKDVYKGHVRISRGISDYLARLTAAMVPYQGAFNARNNFRLEPSMLCLAGKPGIGKTLLSMHICAAVMLGGGLIPADSTPDKVKSNVFQKGVSPYWNGYARQLCFVNDDAFQKRVTAQDEENDYMNILRMIGSFAFPLNFADVASKGKIYFASEFVYASTNATCLYSEASQVLNDVPAIIRRINHPYVLTVKEEYSLPNGMLDYNKYVSEHAKCASNVGIERFPWYIWEAAHQDFLNGVTSNVKVPLSHVIKEICSELSCRKAVHSIQTSQLDDFITGFRPLPVVDGPNTIDMLPLPVPSDGNITIENQAGLWSYPERWANTCSRWSARLFSVPYVCYFEEDYNVARTKAQYLADVLALVIFTFSTYAGTCLLIHSIKALFLIVDYFVTGCKTTPIIDDADVVRPQNKQPVEQSNRPIALRVQHLPVRNAVFQAGDKAPVNNVYSNAYKMYVEAKHGFQVIGQVNFLNDRLAVQPLHFTSLIRKWHTEGKVDDSTNLTFRCSVNHECVFFFTVKHYLSMPRYNVGNGDCEFLRFSVARAHRNVIGNYMKEADLKSLPGWRFRLDVVEIDDRKVIKTESTRKAYFLKRVQLQEDLRVDGVTTPRSFVYDASTDCGDCGATLSIVDNTNFSGRTCVGFHIAGSPQDEIGFSVILTQEMILKAQKELKVINDLFTEDLAQRGIVAQASDDHFLSRPGSTIPICVLEVGVPLCPKSSYYKTSLYGEFGVYDCLPAELSPVIRDGECVFPMVNALEAYTSPVLHYEQPWLKQAFHVAMKPFMEEAPWKPRLLSFDEAVCGVPQEKIRSIPRGTAAGFPYLFDVRDGKKEFFGDAQDYVLDGELCVELRKRVDYVIENARQGNRLSHVFVDFLKDELRPAAKVQAVATRLISCSPLDYTIAWRMYFASFSSMIMRLHVKTSMAPGICAYTDWDQLANKLKLKGTKVFDGDFKRFDATEQPTVHALMLSFINDFYDDGAENALIREVLWADMVHSRHVGGLGFSQKTIYQWNKSLPSGHPFTTIANSMYSLFMIVAAYVSTTGDMTGFWDHVSAVVYGDDNAVNADDSVIERFNQVTVSDALAKEFNMVYTAGSKDGKLEPYTTLENITFLKRGIVRHDDGYYMSPLELNSFMYTPYWCKNKKLEKKILVDVLEIALFELSQHPQEVWDLFAPKILKVFNKRGHVSSVVMDRNEYLKVLRTRSDAWY